MSVDFMTHPPILGLTMFPSQQAVNQNMSWCLCSCDSKSPFVSADKRQKQGKQIRTRSISQGQLVLPSSFCKKRKVEDIFFSLGDLNMVIEGVKFQALLLAKGQRST